ncbi:MAG TPA: type I-B CRISPR-associated endonuclease Cas1b [Thermodesulfobacteriota bacterium]|nr:type I-B CRISPR-associated endonuclease Cas1b [Thermodesulfobacteriota bacterium]
MKTRIFIFSDGELKRKENTLFFENEKGEKKFIPVEGTQELMLFGEVTLNKRFLEFATQREIILHFFNHYGYYIGSFYPREHLNSGYMILKQAEVYLSMERRIELARKFVGGAISNISKVLDYYARRKGSDSVQQICSRIKELESSLPSQNASDSLMAIEGNVRNMYYSAFDEIIGDENFKFEGRTKRPPKNRINALISFGNSLLYTTVLSEIYKTHLDPRIGFLHSTNFRRFSLNLDVAEIFKPIFVDRMILSLINKGELKGAHFEKRMDGVIMNEEGKKTFVKEFEDRLHKTIKHKKIGKPVSNRRLIRLELYKLEKHIMGEEEYKPFIWEW